MKSQDWPPLNSAALGERCGLGTVVCGLIVAAAVMGLLSGYEPGRSQEAPQEPLVESGGIDARSREKVEGTRLGLPLVEAIIENDLDALDRLLWQGADPNVVLMPEEDAEARDAAGALEPAFREHQPGNLTLLHLAASLSRAGAVRLLLDHGADVHASDELGATPLHNVYDQHFAALMTGLTKEIEDAQRRATVKALLEHGADPLAPGGMSGTGSMFLAKVALRHPGDLDLLRPRAGQPQDLVHAALTGDVQQVQYWLRQESDHAEMQRVWATYLAAGLGHLDVLRVLVASGADADGQIPQNLRLWIMSPGHRRPFEAAAAAGHVAVVRYLLGQGVEASEQRFAGRLNWRLAGVTGSCCKSWPTRPPCTWRPSRDTMSSSSCCWNRGQRQIAWMGRDGYRRSWRATPAITSWPGCWRPHVGTAPDMILRNCSTPSNGGIIRP